MVWWLWVLAGIGLLVVELITPGGLFALFFGVGAFCTAIAAAAGASLPSQWVLFTLISLVLLGTLRGTLRDRLAGREPPVVDSLVGEEVVLLQDLPAGGVGKAELRGVPWSARATSGEALPAGRRCRVERVEGLTLWLRTE